MATDVEPVRLPGPARLLVDRPGRRDRVRHIEVLAAREGSTAEWPEWSDPEVVAAWRRAGVDRPWVHQVTAAELAWAGRSLVVSTGTASGKSLAYLLPTLTALRRDRDLPRGGPTALYLSPTKALAADQLSKIESLGDLGVRAAVLDGDTPIEDRRWIREYASLVLTNPDMLHRTVLPRHSWWRRFLRSLRFVVVDECHVYRGVFGSHVSAVLRRLRRLAAHHGADPVFVLASATTADPEGTARRLLGLDLTSVTEDHSPRGRTTFLLWEPELLPDPAGAGTATADSAGAAADPRPPAERDGARRTALAETTDLLADLVSARVPTLAFVPSRRGAELVAAGARDRLSERGVSASARVASYRAGYLPEERRRLEADLRSGALLGLATTNALELGMDVSGLDAVLICGWPGRLTSLWQQAGRAGRRHGEAVAVLVARDDPLDTYLLSHPEAVFGRPVEATVLDPDNPYVLAPHLCAAAAELPLRPAELALFGTSAADLVSVLADRGALRARPSGWYWARPANAPEPFDLRGGTGDPVRIVEGGTGRLLGTVDSGASRRAVHPGAVYLHQGVAYLVRDLDLDEGVALVEDTDGRITTQARDLSEVRILGTRKTDTWGPVDIGFGPVEVTSQVVSFLRRDAGTGRVLGEEPLDLPTRTLRTNAVWWSVPLETLSDHGIRPPEVPGAAHAAEHAAIGLLPLLASCDRWDVGGVSTALHPDTGHPTVVVHDAHPGGAGFAERGFHTAVPWLVATREAIRTCPCRSGCPSCIHSPKCGNGNEPLDKAGAVHFLDALLATAATP
jgi:DEAD/DEAH box helicase domain-containing protein